MTMEINRFGERMYSIPELVEDPTIMNYIAESLRSFFRYLGYDCSQLEEILGRTLSSFDSRILKENSRLRDGGIEYDLPEELLDFYQKAGYREKRAKRTKGRAKSIFDAVSQHLNGEVALDVGTGNSSVALMLHKAGYRINTMDITDNRCREAKDAEGLRFKLHEIDEPLRYPSNSYDPVLTMAVLHHCDNPARLLNEAVRISKRGVIIYESTFGISKEDMPPELIKTNPRLYNAYLKLSREQQKMYCIFLDWFLNKIEYRNDAHIPANFASPDGWEKIFREKGLDIKQRRIVGFDNPGISEFHVLYALEKAS